MDYGLNSKDLWAVFGVKVVTGSSTFLQYNKRKDSLSHDFPEEMGIDIDLTQPTLSSRQPTLSCVLKATSRDDFFNKYDGLFTELRQLGTLEIYIADHNRNYILYWTEQQNISKLSQIDTTYIGVTFDLVFAETNPTDNISAVYLVDEHDNYIIA
jgi:hypothetical protein